MTLPTWIGNKLNNRYEITEQLGVGGMSAVYKAYDPNLKRVVAVKLIHSHLSRDAEFIRRFEVEATVVAGLRHPNIVQVYDFAHEGDLYYMVLEYVVGETLQGKLARLSPDGRKLPVEEVIRLTLKICAAIDYAHKNSLIHRDIKPANIIINPDGEPVLMDFGIVKIVGGEHHTATGKVIGTAQYMAPEQIHGERPDHRADIYSLGVLLFEMLSGQPPFQADSAPTVMLKHVNDPVPDILSLSHDTPPAFKAILEKALAKKPADRFQSAGDLGEAIRRVAAKISPPAPAPPPKVVKPPEPRPPAPVQPERTIIEKAPAAPPAPAGRPAPARAETRKGGPKPALFIGGAAVIGLVVVVALLAVIAPRVLGGAGATDPAPTLPIAAVESTATSAPEDVATQAPAAATDIPASPTSAPTASPTPAVTGLSAQILDAYGVSMVLIPGGAFLMGSDAGGDEGPIHSVFLEKYYIDQYEVTNGQYAACVDAGVCEEVNSSELRDPEFAGFPVRYVRWEQAAAYCAWRGGALPTEAQWEKAARGGLPGMLYPWGDEPAGCEIGSANGAQYASCGANTVPVGSFAPNSYGLYDVVGNVWEWTADWYDRTFYEEAPESNPLGPEFGTLRVRRGGSWGYNDDYLRVANRTSVEPVSYVDIGIRCAALP